MNTKDLGANITLLTTNHGDEVLFAGSKALAGFSPLVGYYVTKEECTEEESTQIKKYLKDVRQPIRLTEEQMEQLFL